ncbi:MAG: carbonic anhydrase [Actinomycetia bacterium]|nr:carbonic anhydrase [Actinomycetes bacterium]
MRRKILAIAISVMLLAALVACGSPGAQTDTQTSTQNSGTADTGQAVADFQTDVHNPAAEVTDASEALQYLKDGNRRYVEDKGINRDTNAADRDVLKDGQKPFAIVLTCSDSRDSPEIYFDQKLGDIFVIRNAGNIADITALGSMEYAAEHLHAPLVVVVGHSSCGAVTAAVQGGTFPEALESIVNTIKASIGNETDVDTAIHTNVDSVVSKIKNDEIAKSQKVTVIGAYYNIVTGEVTWND